MEPHMIIISSASKMLMKKEKNLDINMDERERQKLLKRPNNFIDDFNKGLKTGDAAKAPAGKTLRLLVSCQQLEEKRM